MTLTASATRTAAQQLASFCGGLRWSELPVEVRERAKELTLDHLGVALRGSAEPSSQPVRTVAREIQSTGGASVVGGGFCTSPAWAGLANGTSAHALELDDVTTESSLHPGVAVIPGAFALAEERGSRPGDFLAAVVAGYEVTMRVGAALNPASTYQRGFHPTGVAGVFGAATAAGLLLELDADTLARALGVAGTLAAGSLEYLADGSWTKRLNPGWAAHSGVLAAQLAQAGFNGPSTVFEGRLGVLRAYTDQPLPDRLLDGLGESFEIMRVSIKPYACCRYNHGLIDCILALRSEHQIEPNQVESIRLGVLSAGRLLVAEPIEQKRAPKNIVDAQFSAPFAAAVALARGAADLNQFTQANIDDPLIGALMVRTECFYDDSLEANFPRRWPAAVEIRLGNGQTVSRRIESPTGEPENPVSRDGLIAKFTSLASSVISADAARELAERVLRLEDERNLRAVAAVLRG